MNRRDPSPSPRRTTVGQVYAALDADAWATGKLADVHRKLAEGARAGRGEGLGHMNYVRPSEAKCDIREVSEWVQERFGPPGAPVPKRTAFGYLSDASRPWNGWIVIFAAAMHGRDEALARDFSATCAPLSWSGGETSRSASSPEPETSPPARSWFQALLGTSTVPRAKAAPRPAPVVYAPPAESRAPESRAPELKLHRLVREEARPRAEVGLVRASVPALAPVPRAAPRAVSSQRQVSSRSRSPRSTGSLRETVAAVVGPRSESSDAEFFDDLTVLRAMIALEKGEDVADEHLRSRAEARLDEARLAVIDRDIATVEAMDRLERGERVDDESLRARAQTADQWYDGKVRARQVEDTRQTGRRVRELRNEADREMIARAKVKQPPPPRLAEVAVAEAAPAPDLARQAMRAARLGGF